MSEDNEIEDRAWHSCEAEKPLPYTVVELMLPDATVKVGFWAGSNYWIAGGDEVNPTNWRPLT